MTERDIQADVLRYLSTLPGLRIWRANTGTGISMDGKRIMSFGVIGQADLSGILQGGRRLEIETKTPIGRQSKEQAAFQAMIERFGGLYVLARSVEDVRVAIECASRGDKP